MRDRTSFRKQLGFTQQEMAVLMGISRSHYSMYERGSRSWPIGTPTFINDLVLHFSNSKVPEQDSLLRLATQKLIREAKLLLRENEHQERLIARKIEAAEVTEASLLKRLEVVSLLNSENAKTGSPNKRHINFIALKCGNHIQEEIVSELFHLRLKLKTLQHNSALIRIELEKVTKK